MKSKLYFQLLIFLVVLMFAQFTAMAAPILVVNDSIIASESAPVIVSGRLLIPARVVSEQLGAQVKWLKAKNTVQITKGKSVIELAVGAKQVKVSGKTVQIDSPVQIINSRIYVPLRFIGESLGATVSWDKKANTASIKAKSQTTAIKQTTVKPVTPVPAVASDEIATTAVPKLIVNDSIIVSESVPVIISGHLLIPARVVSEQLGAQVKWLKAKNTVQITKGKSVIELAVGAKQVKVSGKTVEIDSPVQIINSRIYVPLRFIGESLGATVSWDKKANTASLKAKGSTAAVPKVATKSLPSAQPVVKPVIPTPAVSSDKTTASTVPPVVANNTIADNIKDQTPAGEPVIITPVAITPAAVNPISTPQTSLKQIIPLVSPCLEQAELSQGITSTTLTLTSDHTFEGNYRISYVDSGIAIDFPFMTSALKSTMQSAGSVTSCQIVENPQIPKGIRLELGLPIRAKYNTSLSADGKTLNLDILTAIASTVPNLSQKKIIIDPGHGGMDTGAVACDGSYEKDDNLALSNSVFQKLNTAGAQVTMIRYDDTYLTLKQITDMANSDGGDIFISFHQNSSTNKSAAGTEAFYYSNPMPSQKLAKLLADKVSAVTGFGDRGAKKNMFYVVTHTNMPSALLETGFISNPNENVKIKDHDFNEAVAQAVYQAVSAYFLP